MNGLTIRFDTSPIPGYYITHNPQSSSSNASDTLMNVAWILSNDLEYTTRFFDFDNKVLQDGRIPRNPWKGCETNNLLKLAEHSFSQSNSSHPTLFAKIKKLAEDKINGVIPAEVIKAREMGYVGNNVTEAMDFIREFGQNIGLFFKTLVASGVINEENSSALNILETIKKVRNRLNSQPELKEKVSRDVQSLFHIYSTPALVQFLILTGIRPHNDILWTWLNDLLIHDRFTELEYLLRYYHEPDLINISSHFQPSLLCKAVHVNFIVARKLIDYGADLNAVYRNQTVLEHALSSVQQGNIEEYLIVRGADLRKGDPITAAIYGYRSDPFIQDIIDKGADPTSRKAFLATMEIERCSLAKMLIDNGAIPDPKDLLELSINNPRMYQCLIKFHIISKVKLS